MILWELLSRFSSSSPYPIVALYSTSEPQPSNLVPLPRNVSLSLPPSLTICLQYLWSYPVIAINQRGSPAPQLSLLPCTQASSARAWARNLSILDVVRFILLCPTAYYLIVDPFNSHKPVPDLYVGRSAQSCFNSTRAREYTRCTALLNRCFMREDLKFYKGLAFFLPSLFYHHLPESLLISNKDKFSSTSTPQIDWRSSSSLAFFASSSKSILSSLIKMVSQALVDKIYTQFGPYGYNPSEAAAIVFTIVFALLTIVHFIQVIWTREWFLLVVVFGALLEASANAIRIYGSLNPTVVDPYIAQQVSKELLLPHLHLDVQELTSSSSPLDAGHHSSHSSLLCCHSFHSIG